jgi:hypothetical protein
MTRQQLNSLVMATVNAPYSEKLDADTLAHYLAVPEEMELAAAHLGSFFYEVKVPLQKEFAKAHGISMTSLSAAAAHFDEYSGHTWGGKTAA